MNVLGRLGPPDLSVARPACFLVHAPWKTDVEKTLDDPTIPLKKISTIQQGNDFAMDNLVIVQL